MKDKIRRVVILPGLFGASISSLVLEEMRQRSQDCKVISLHPGPASSIHDRASECFYMLRGGRVDYGAQHSFENGHGRCGEFHRGQLLEWDEDHPIDVVAYSLGASTARYLQHLLIRGAFTDSAGRKIPTTGAWIRCIVTIQGCNNGSHCVHFIGLGLKSLQPQRFTILWFIFSVLYLCHWIFGDLLEEMYPLNVNHWEWWGRDLSFLSNAPVDLTQPVKPSSRAHGKSLSDLFSTWPLLNDNAGRDLSPKRMQELNKELSISLPYPGTTYVACVAKATVPVTTSHNQSFHLPSPTLLLCFPENLILIPLSLFLGFFGGLMHHITTSEGFPNDLAAHVTSDGIVSIAGQRHPSFEAATSAACSSFQELSSKVESGKWTHVLMPGHWNHIETMRYGHKQISFFSDLQNFLLEKE